MSTPDPLGFTSVQDRKRLLELYPISTLRGQWNREGTKAELCFSVAGEAPRQEIIDFTQTYLGCCRQHVYIYSHAIDIDHLPDIAIPDAVKVSESHDANQRQLFYLVRFSYIVVLRDPLEETELRFLWPVRFDFTKDHLAVKFVTLEKAIGTYFEGRTYYVSRRSLDERTILRALEESIPLEVTDLHAGVKQLWDDGKIDSPRAKFKKAISTSDEAMDEDRFIREHDPELYEIVKESPLFNTLFHVMPEHGLEPTVFSVDPSKGFINFVRYSEHVGDTDNLVTEVLNNNQ
jgi:hypothetical protein